jgi:hypothetical protein
LEHITVHYILGNKSRAADKGWAKTKGIITKYSLVIVRMLAVGLSDDIGTERRNMLRVVINEISRMSHISICTGHPHFSNSEMCDSRVG